MIFVIPTFEKNSMLSYTETHVIALLCRRENGNTISRDAVRLMSLTFCGCHGYFYYLLWHFHSMLATTIYSNQICASVGFIHMSWVGLGRFGKCGNFLHSISSINQSINQHELAMAPHIQSSGAPEIQWKYNSITVYYSILFLMGYCKKIL